MTFICQGCGQILAHDGIRVKVVCPECGVMTDLRGQGFKRPEGHDLRAIIPPDRPIAGIPQRNNRIEKNPDTDESKAKAAVKISDIALKKVIAEDFQSSHEDDGLAYGIGDVGDFYCPGCTRVMESGTVLCVHCGFHVNKGSKVQRKHLVVDMSWVEGLSRFSRLMSCGIFCGATVMLMIMGGEFGAEGSRVTIAIAILGMIQAMVMMGTYGALHLKRNARGHIRLKRFYWILFIPIQNTDQAVTGYNGIRLTQTSTAGPVDYVMCFILLIPFVLPSILWYIFQMHRPVFEVALTKDGGRMVRRIFISREDNKTLEIARMLHEMSGLPLNTT